VCVLLERGDLSFIGTQEEANRLQWNVSASATNQIPFMHGMQKRKNVSAQGIPANRDARVVTRRAVEEEDACRSSLLMHIPQVEHPPL
jgi:hypothetical protein